MDYYAVKEPVVNAMRSAGLVVEDVVGTEDLPGMLQCLQIEENVSISVEVEAEITKAIEAYKRA